MSGRQLSFDAPIAMPRDPELFDGFVWPVPTAFASELAKCRFERGDIFYDTPRGYLVWEEALKHVVYSLQVRFPAHEAATKAPTDASVFAGNWKSPVGFTLTNYKSKETNEITTTQGRLYTLLWRGEWKVLGDSDEPTVPLTCLDSEITTLAKRATVTIKAKFCAHMKAPNLFLVPRDTTNPISVAKCEAIRKGLARTYKVAEKLFAPDEIGMDGILVAPTIRFMCFMIETQNSEGLFHALKDVLYVPAEDTKTNKRKFNLKVHGGFLPFKVLPFGDFYSWVE